MKALLDTHILLWALTEDRKLPKAACRLIEDETNPLYVSAVTLWEVAIKHACKPEQMPFSAGFLLEKCREAGVTLLPIRDSHVLGLESLCEKGGAAAHKDPFDRMLVAQAKTENLTLVTHDGRLADYGENFVLVV